MNRRELLKASLPAGILGLVPAVTQSAPKEEKLFFHDLLWQPQYLGVWLRTWGELDYTDPYDSTKAIPAKIGLARIEPPAAIGRLDRLASPSYAQGEVVCLWYKVRQAVCDQPACFCQTVPPRDALLAIGLTAKSSFVDRYTLPMISRPCSSCGKPASGFRHATAEEPNHWICWDCNRERIHSGFYHVKT